MSYFGSYECMDMHCPGSKSDEQLAAAIAAYLEDHPIDAGLDEAELAAYLAENGYLTNTELADAITQALAEAKASGQFDGAPGKTGTDGSPGADGADGVGIQSVEQTTTSAEDGGTNIVTVTKTDGTTSTFQVKNGSKGSDGADGQPGTNGKSAYQYAVEGGYAGTEAEFAAKLAEEMPDKLPNPNALAFTGAATGSYDGSAALSVEIPSGGEKWETILDLTLEEDVNKVVLMSGEVGYKKILVYMKSVPPTDQTVTSNQAISIYSGETNMADATAKLNSAYLYNGNRLSGVSIELTPYAANIFASGTVGWNDSGAPTGANMGYSSKNSLSKPIKKLTAQVWSNALFGVGSWFKVYGVRV